jgi:hypothetical protein
MPIISEGFAEKMMKALRRAGVDVELLRANMVRAGCNVAASASSAVFGLLRRRDADSIRDRYRKGIRSRSPRGTRRVDVDWHDVAQSAVGSVLLGVWLVAPSISLARRWMAPKPKPPLEQQAAEVASPDFAAQLGEECRRR